MMAEKPFSKMWRGLVLLLVCGTSTALTQTSATDYKALSEEISRQLAGSDPALRTCATDRIRKLLVDDPARTTWQLRGQFLKIMLDTGQNDAAQDLALRAILANPSDTAVVEGLQQSRIRALLNGGKTEQALVAAKSLYNVCGMGNTASAMLAVAECLNAAHPDDASFVQRFKAEQLAGAALPGGDKPSTKPAGPSVLSAIRIPAEAYAPVIRQIIAEDFNSLMGKGNLLLLADRTNEAMAVFERAYGVAAEYQIVAASEAIARCMRAQDGTIGRANAWVLSIRPKSNRR